MSFVSDFQITDYDYKLKEVIDSRKQKVNERIMLYFSTMESLFSQLHKPFPEKQKIDILRRNLLSNVGKRLNPDDLKFVEALLQSCKWIETYNEISDNNPNTY